MEYLPGGYPRRKLATMHAQTDGLADVLPMRCILPDGVVDLIRAVRPDDVTRLERLFYRLSPQSIASYFFLPVPTSPDGQRGGARWR